MPEEAPVFFQQYRAWFTTGFPQVYVQVLARVLLALSWTDTEVNEVRTRALSSVGIWCTQAAGSWEQRFYSEPERRNRSVQQCISCPETDETSSTRRAPNPGWQIPGAPRCDCISVPPANYELHALECRDTNAEARTLTCLPGNTCPEGAIWAPGPPKQEHRDGFAKAFGCAAVLCLPAVIQCNFVAFKGYASVIMVMERVNVWVLLMKRIRKSVHRTEIWKRPRWELPSCKKFQVCFQK